MADETRETRQFKAVCKELKIRQDVTEAAAVADVVLDAKAGTLEIAGLPPKLNMDDIVTSCDAAYTDVESVVGPAQLGPILQRNPEIIVKTVDGGEVRGKTLGNYRAGSEITLVQEDGTVTMLPNARVVKKIELAEKLRGETLLRVAYARDKADNADAQLSIYHLLHGLSFGGIVYELGFGKEKLGLSPFVYVKNSTSFDFEDVKLTLVMPERPEPEGDEIEPEVYPLEQRLPRSKRIRVRHPPVVSEGPRHALMARASRVRSLGDEDMGAMGEMCLVEAASAPEIEPEETIEGTVAAVDTEGKYSLSQGENKRARLKGVAIDGYHRANVLLLNTESYTHDITMRTSVIDSVRFTPDCDLKAGSFYFDGQKLQFPAMKKEKEYELGLRACRNLEAQVSRESSKRMDDREERRIITTTYSVKVVNNTGEKQKVEMNIPVEPITKAGAKFNTDLVPAEETITGKRIAGELCYVFEVGVEPGSTKEFKFSTETR